MNISQDQQTQMRASAGFDYQSLGEMLNQQLTQAIGQQQAGQAASDRMQGMAPEVEKDVGAMRNLDQRVEGQRPSEMLGAASSLGEAFTRHASAAADSASNQNVLSILTQMVGLQTQKEELDLKKSANERAEQELQMKQAELMKEGWIADPETGEYRPMNEDELIDYQAIVGGVDDVTLAYLEMFESGAMKNINEIPAADRGEVVKQLATAGINPNDIAKKKEGELTAGVVRQLFENYTEANLARGRVRGFLTNVLGEVGIDPQAKRYKALKEGTLASIRNFVGEKGIMTDTDAKRIAELIPDVNSTTEEAKLAWKDIDAIFRSTYGFSVIPEVLSGGGGEGSEEDLKEEFNQLWDSNE